MTGDSPRTTPPDFDPYYLVDEAFIEAVVAVAWDLPGSYGWGLYEDLARVRFSVAAAVQVDVKNHLSDNVRKVR